MKAARRKWVFPRFKDKRGGFLNFADYRRAKNKIGYGVIVFLLFIFAFMAIFPIVYLFASSMKSVSEINSATYSFWPREWDFGKIARLWERFNFGRYYLNTFVYVLGSVVAAVIFNSLLAYAIAVVKPFGHKVINTLIFLGYMVPTILNIFPLLQEIKDFGFLNPDHQSYLTFLPLWLGFGANAYYYMLFRDYFSRLPKSLVEAARMDGADQLQIFTRVVLPLSRPIIGIVAIFAMTASYSDFLLPYCVLQNQEYQTIVVGIYNISNTNPPLQLPDFLLLILLSVIPQIIIFLIFQRQIMNVGASKGSKE